MAWTSVASYNLGYSIPNKQFLFYYTLAGDNQVHQLFPSAQEFMALADMFRNNAQLQYRRPILCVEAFGRCAKENCCYSAGEPVRPKTISRLTPREFAPGLAASLCLFGSRRRGRDLLICASSSSMTDAISGQLRARSRVDAHVFQSSGTQSKESVTASALKQRRPDRPAQERLVYTRDRVRPFAPSPCKQQVHLRESSGTKCQTSREAVQPRVRPQIAARERNFASSDIKAKPTGRLPRECSMLCLNKRMFGARNR